MTLMDQPYPAIKYTSRDYAAIRQQMIDSIDVRLPEWTSRSPQDFGIVLIELFATMGDILGYYTDRVANEAFLGTATQRDSVLKIAAGLNYRPRGTAASTTSVTFTTTIGAAVTIPAGTVLRSSTSNGSTPVIFTTDTALNIPAGAATGSVSVTQGQAVLQELIGIATGDVDQTFVLLQIPVVESSIQIQIKESPVTALSTWSFVTNLVDARPTDSVYTTTIDANGVVTVTFGDGVNGKIPPLSAAIYASYRVGGGAIGNVAANTIVEMASPIVGVLSLTNPDAATGGTSAESTDAVRANAPRSLTSLNRAVTLEDYASLALQVPEVAKANSEALVYSNVSIFVAPFGGGQPSQRLLNDVVSYMASRKFVGVDVVAASPTYVDIDVTVTVTVNAAYTRAQVQSDVAAAITSYLAFDNVDFGKLVTVGEIYSAIVLTAGVDAASLTQLSRRGEGGVADIFLSANEIPQPGTLLAVNAVGGIVAGDPAGMSASTDTQPGSTTIPTLTLFRCDPTSMRIGLAWSPGSDNTKWYVEVRYLDTVGNFVGSTVVGPTTIFSDFQFDIPNNDDAVTLSMRVQAYNGNVGPAYGPYLATPNVCAL
jgi:uncharacterized phage protein gp47/JayE